MSVRWWTDRAGSVDKAMKKLTNKTAIVTGGRQGIGRTIVDAFLDEGATVVTCGRGPRPADLPDSALWQTTDVSNSEAVYALRDRVTAELGQLSILVNNAGVQIEKTILETSDDDWDRLMGVNAKGVFQVCRALLPLMATTAILHAGSAGSIINIGSISGKVADPELALYNASKAFVHGLTRSIAVDHGPAVRCNAICPGWILTDMADAAFEMAAGPEAAKADALAHHPIGRFGTPADVAKLAVWLASDDSAFATGQCYTLDGGLTAASPINTANQ